MERTVVHARTALLAAGLCVLLTGFSGCRSEDGLRVIASTECEGPLVAALDSGEGGLVWAGRSVYSFERGALKEVMGFSGDYSGTGLGFGNPSGAMTAGVTGIGERRLVLVRRGVFDGEIEGASGVLEHHELVAAEIDEGGARTEVVLSCPQVLEVMPFTDIAGAGVACVSADAAGERAWLSAGVVGDAGTSIEMWDHEIAGRPQAMTVREGSDGTSIAVVGLVPGSFEPRLEVVDVGGAVLETASFEYDLTRPARLFAYSHTTRGGWLIEWWEDEGNRLTVTSGAGESLDVTGELTANGHNQVLSVGEVLGDWAGDELVMNFGRADSGSRRAVVASLSDGRLEVIRELAPVAMSAARIVDVNGDGLPDVVCVESVPGPQQVSHRSAERVGVWISDGDGFEQPRYSGTYEVGVSSFDCADLDGDGVLEVLVGYESASGDRARADVLKLR